MRYSNLASRDPPRSKSRCLSQYAERVQSNLELTKIRLIVFGLALSNWICLGFSRFNSSIQWRFPLAFQVVFAFVVVTLVPFLPESPRWLISNGKMDEGEKVLARLQGKSIEDPEVAAQRDEIVEILMKEERAGKASWKEIFTQGELKYFIRMLIGMGPLLMNQWCGINTLSYSRMKIKLTAELTFRLSSKMSLD
jgi:Sugar (and other) transporter